MKKTDDRITNTSNIMYGSDLRALRAKDLARWKRRAARKIEAQKYKKLSESMTEAGWQQTWNDACDAALKIINAKWKNI